MLATAPFHIFTSTPPHLAQPQSPFGSSKITPDNRLPNWTDSPSSRMIDVLAPRSVNAAHGRSIKSRRFQPTCQSQEHASGSSKPHLRTSFLNHSMNENTPDWNSTQENAGGREDVWKPMAFGGDAAHDSQEQSSGSNSVFAASAIQRSTAPSLRPAQLRERRRNAFLGGVRERRDEKRFATREDDMLRLDFMQRQRQWEQQQALLAIDMDDMYDDDDETAANDDLDLPTWPSSTLNSYPHPPPTTQESILEDEIDEFEMYEDGELQELLSYLPENGGSTGGMQPSDARTHTPTSQDSSPWSDDADYDAIFSEAWASSHFPSSFPLSAPGTSATGLSSDHISDEMDMS